MKKTLSLLIAALMLLALCGCGSAGGSRSASTAPMASNSAQSYDYAVADEYYGGFAVEEMDYEKSAVSSDGGGSSAPALDPEKIIYSASATVETTDFEDSLRRLQELVGGCGGFVESSSINGSNYYSQSRGYSYNRSADYTIRVPSEYFSEIMNSLSTLGNIPYSHTYTENITAQYYDVQARLTAYETQEQRLLEMMQIAETVEDIITIEDRLTELRYQIDSLQSTLKNWDRQVSYSSIYLTVSEVSVYTPESSMSYGQKLSLAFQSGLSAVGEFFSDFLLGLLEALPALIVLAVVIVVIVVIVRRSVKKRRAKKAEQSEG